MTGGSRRVASLNQSGLLALRETFLRRVPDFGDFTEPTGTYWREEREYKEELVALTQAMLTRDLFAGSPTEVPQRVIAAVRRILAGRLSSIGRPQNLVSWRYFDFLRHLERAEALVFSAAMQDLVFSVDESPERVQRFTDAMWPAMARISANPPYAQVRMFPTFFLMMMSPATDIAVRSDMFGRTTRQLLGRSLLRSASFSASEYHELLGVATTVYDALDSWGWCPRDMIDVHSFLWTATAMSYNEDIRATLDEES